MLTHTVFNFSLKYFLDAILFQKRRKALINGLGCDFDMEHIHTERQKVGSPSRVLLERKIFKLSPFES